MIMIDETQDFDLIMLNILLNDTTIPKIFVGDPKQSIYQFRGADLDNYLNFKKEYNSNLFRRISINGEKGFEF